MDDFQDIIFTDSDVLRVDLGGQWLVDEFAAMLSDFQRLYEIRAALDSDVASRLRWGVLQRDRRTDVPPWLAIGVPLVTYSPWRLTLSQVEYASPGFVDLLGAGKIIEQIRIFAQYLLDRPDERKRAALERETMRLQNAQLFLNLERDALEIGLQPGTVRSLLLEVSDTEDRLSGSIEAGRITGFGAPPPQIALPAPQPEPA